MQNLPLRGIFKWQIVSIPRDGFGKLIYSLTPSGITGMPEQSEFEVTKIGQEQYNT
jgi:hypothetical protein